MYIYLNTYFILTVNAHFNYDIPTNYQLCGHWKDKVTLSFSLFICIPQSATYTYIGDRRQKKKDWGFLFHDFVSSKTWQIDFNKILMFWSLFISFRKKKRNRNLTAVNRSYLTDEDFIASSVPELKTLTLNSPTRIKTPTKLFQPQRLWLQVSFQKMRMCSRIVVLAPLLACCKCNHSLFF